MHNRNSVSKTRIKALYCLKRECDLRDQHYGLSAAADDMLDTLHIYFCLTASGNTMQQIYLLLSRIHIATDLRYSLLLLLIQYHFFICRMKCVIGIAVRSAHLYTNPSFVLHCSKYR